MIKCRLNVLLTDPGSNGKSYAPTALPQGLTTSLTDRRAGHGITTFQVISTYQVHAERTGCRTLEGEDRRSEKTTFALAYSNRSRRDPVNEYGDSGVLRGVFGDCGLKILANSCCRHHFTVMRSWMSQHFLLELSSIGTK